MAPSRFSSLRGRPITRSQSESQARPGKLQPQHIPAPASAEPLKPPRASSSSTSSSLHLIAFRYEQTVQAQPPIPIPPPRNPLRIARPHAAASAVALTSPPTDDAPPAFKLAAASAAAAAAKATTNDDTETPELPRKQSHIVVPPPSIAPSHTLLKTEQHPALRSAQFQTNTPHSPVSSSITYTDWKRDSALGTLSSASTSTSATIPDEIDSFSSSSDHSKFELSDKPASIRSVLTVDGSVQPPSTHSRSIHSRHHKQPPQPHQQPPRISCQSRWSFSESEVDVSDTESLRVKASSNRLIRGLSFRLAASKPKPKPKPKPKSKRSNDTRTRYGSISPVDAATEAMRAATFGGPAPVARQQQPHKQPQQSVRSARPQSTSPPNNTSPDPQSIAGQEIGHNDSQSPISSHPEPGLAPGPSPAPGPLLLSSSTASFDDTHLHSPPPIINTNIPEGSLLDDADLDSLRFSNRGSIYFGGRRAISAPTHSAAGVPRPPTNNKFIEPRAAPPAPASPTNAVAPGGFSLTTTMSATTDVKTGRSRTSAPPDIRVMLSEDTERESQKVRSLYESADPVHWEDGAAPGRHSGELLEPSSKEVPSDGDDNFAYGFPLALRLSSCGF